MSSEYSEYRVESNLKLEERARREAWQEAGALEQRQRRLNERVAQAEMEYGPDLMGRRTRAPKEPRRSCERPEIERYVKDLRQYCAATETQLDRAMAMTERAIAQAWDEASELRERHGSLNRKIEEAVRLYGESVRTPPDALPEDPASGCGRAEIENHVRALRVQCDDDERRLEEAIAGAKRFLAEAWVEADAIERRKNNLEQRAEAVAERGLIESRTQPPRRPAESAQLGEIRAYVVEMKAYCDIVEDALGRANVDAERSALLAEIGSQASESGSEDDLFAARQGHVASIDAAAIPGASSRDGEEGEDVAKQETSRVLGGLSEAVSPNERDALERIAASFVEAEASKQHGRAKTLLIELRVGVQQANESAALASDEAAQEAERVAVLKEKLRGLEGSDVREIVDEIARMEREEAPLTVAFAVRAKQVGRAARERADRAYAAEVMREELERLGYEVGGDFESVFVAGGEKLVRKPRAGDYGVVVEVYGAQVHVEPVRIGQPFAERPRRAQPEDLEAGKACCQDFRRMRAAMKERGVTNKVSRIDPVGSQPLRMVASEPVGSGQRPGAVDTGRRRPDRRQRSRS